MRVAPPLLCRTVLTLVASMMLALPVRAAQTYVVGNSDVLKVTVWSQPELSGELARL